VKHDVFVARRSLTGLSVALYRRPMDASCEPVSHLDCLELRPRGAASGLAFVLHGLGLTKDSLIELGELFVEDGIVAVLPDAPIPHGEGRAWFDRETRSRDLPIARSAILALVRRFQGKYGVGRDKTAVVGFSQGGVAALDFALNHPRLVSRAACLSGYLAVEESPAGTIDPTPSIFMAHGTRDPLIPVERARTSRDLLQDRGIALQYAEYPILHGISLSEIEALRRWLLTGRS
jgi:phospholipase/carboxylesterase